MSEVDSAEHVLLASGGLDMSDCERVLGTLMSHHLDMGELFFQSVRSEAWGLEDGLVKEGTFSADRGVGVRAVSGEKTGFAYADEISREAIERAALAARSIARHGGAGAVKAFTRASPILRYVGADPITTLSADEKVALLGEIDREARRLDPRVKEVTVRVSAVFRNQPRRRERRHAGRGYAPIGAYGRHRDRRAERAPRAGIVRLRRSATGALARRDSARSRARA